MTEYKPSEKEKELTALRRYANKQEAYVEELEKILRTAIKYFGTDSDIMQKAKEVLDGK